MISTIRLNIWGCRNLCEFSIRMQSKMLSQESKVAKATYACISCRLRARHTQPIMPHRSNFRKLTALSYMGYNYQVRPDLVSRDRNQRIESAKMTFEKLKDEGHVVPTEAFQPDFTTRNAAACHATPNSTQRVALRARCRLEIHVNLENVSAVN